VVKHLAQSNVPQAAAVAAAAAHLRKKALHSLGLSEIVAPDTPLPSVPTDARPPQMRPVPPSTIELAAPLPWEEQPAHLFRAVLADAHSRERPPHIDLTRCLFILSPTKVLLALWAECVNAAGIGALPAARQIATFAICTPRAGPPLIPLFMHLVLPQIIANIEQQQPHEQALAIEVLVAVISSSLTVAMHLESVGSVEGLPRSTGAETTLGLSASVARDLKRKEKNSAVVRMILQRLASMHAFASHFPMFIKTT
jgi:mediator of RNA polymerase II transcription subunit 5